MFLKSMGEEKEMFSKTAQMEVSLVVFILLVVGFFYIGITMLKIGNDILNPFEAKVGNMTTTAGRNVAVIHTSFISFWDWAIMMALLFNIILLFLSAFLIDTHPVFIVFYVIAGILIFIFAPMLLDTVNQLYATTGFDTIANTQMPMLNFVRTYFVYIILAIYFLSGIIIYGKVRMGSQSL